MHIEEAKYESFSCPCPDFTSLPTDDYQESGVYHFSHFPCVLYTHMCICSFLKILNGTKSTFSKSRLFSRYTQYIHIIAKY